MISGMSICSRHDLSVQGMPCQYQACLLLTVHNKELKNGVYIAILLHIFTIYIELINNISNKCQIPIRGYGHEID